MENKKFTTTEQNVNENVSAKQNVELLGETLDFSELVNVKGGNMDQKPAGKSGGIVCGCK